MASETEIVQAATSFIQHSNREYGYAFVGGAVLQWEPEVDDSGAAAEIEELYDREEWLGGIAFMSDKDTTPDEITALSTEIGRQLQNRGQHG